MQKFKVLKEHNADGKIYSPTGENNERLADPAAVQGLIDKGILVSVSQAKAKAKPAADEATDAGQTE